MSKKRILVVDDEAIVRNDIASTLAILGYGTAGMAGTGDEAVSRARRDRPDLVLMDIGIPGNLDGIGAAGAIRSELEIPVVFVTSHAEDTVLAAATTTGPYGYVTKPFTPRDLKVAIEVALSRKAAEIRPGPTDADGSRPGNGRSSANIRSLMVEGFFDSTVLYLYHDRAEKDRILALFIERCVGQRTGLLFAYERSTAHRRFQQEVREGLISTCRLKADDPGRLDRALSAALSPGAARPVRPFRFVLDVPDSVATESVLGFAGRLAAIRDAGMPLGGIIAVSAFSGNDELAGALAARIDRVVLTSGTGTTISCAGDGGVFCNLPVLPQPVVDAMVKKVLEPVILTFLDRPVSGNEIVCGIRDRYNVRIPKARVYTCLYALAKKGYLKVEESGRSRIYTPTGEGMRYIRQQLREFNAVVHHIAAGIPGVDTAHRNSTMSAPADGHS
jgi:CheY-like chemotaxis protein/DNA-binding PadR family transcriptional regulator